jgi:hypothetical protein
MNAHHVARATLDLILNVSTLGSKDVFYGKMV